MRQFISYGASPPIAARNGRTTADCIPREAVSQLVDGALRRAGLSKAVSARVVAEVDRAECVTGQVTMVETSPGKRRVAVSQSVGHDVFFWFPPNTPGVEAELLRAQDAGLTVSVLYVISGSNLPNMISQVLVWAGYSGLERY